MGPCLSKKEGNSPDISVADLSHFTHFSYEELEVATENFSEDRLFRDDALGKSYRGNLDGNGLGVGIRVETDSRAIEEWRNEIKYLGQLEHPNATKLIGCHFHGDKKILVFRHGNSITLDQRLFSSEYAPLTLSQRLKIASDAAKGLNFIHSAERQIILQDFKTANILLEQGFKVTLSEFGLANERPKRNKNLSTRGYCAPEYLKPGHLPAKCDIYGFGVVLLEMLAGRKVIDERKYREEQDLVQWCHPMLHPSTKGLYLSTLMDSKIRSHWTSETQMKEAFNLVYRCLSQEPRDRPNMGRVVDTLHSLLNPILTSLRQDPPQGLYSFTHVQMLEATSNLSDKIGEGGFGKVYRGTFNQMECAIKVFKTDISNSERDTSFLKEVNFSRHLQHPNITKVVGYCCEDNHRIVVYEYLNSGSLDKRLYSSNGLPPLTWLQRVKIALDVARGLAFTHSVGIIMVDFKTANILLNQIRLKNVWGDLWHLCKILKEKILDPRLNDQDPPESLTQITRLAHECLSEEQMSRPDMNQVLGRLQLCYGS